MGRDFIGIYKRKIDIFIFKRGGGVYVKLQNCKKNRCKPTKLQKILIKTENRNKITQSSLAYAGAFCFFSLYIFFFHFRHLSPRPGLCLTAPYAEAQLGKVSHSFDERLTTGRGVINGKL